MTKLFFVVEGVADETFLKQLIKLKFPDLDNEIEFIQVQTNGESIKQKRISQIVEKTVSLEEETVFILDADAPDYQSTEDSIIQNFLDEDLELSKEKIFLLPDNSSTGCLEDLLIQCVTEKAEPIFECFESYKECIHQINSEYTKPDLKTKIYAYSEITTSSGNEKKRNYNDSSIWNLNHKSLEPLIEFLNRHLK